MTCPCCLLVALRAFVTEVLPSSKSKPKAPMCCPMDKERGGTRSSQSIFTAHLNPFGTPAPVPLVQSQPQCSPISVPFEKCSARCRIRPGPFASHRIKRKKLKLWSVAGKKCLSCSVSSCLCPVTSFPGHVQAGLSTMQGRVCSFSLPARCGGSWWDLLPVDAKPQPPPQT